MKKIIIGISVIAGILLPKPHQMRLFRVGQITILDLRKI